MMRDDLGKLNTDPDHPVGIHLFAEMKSKEFEAQ